MLLDLTQDEYSAALDAVAAGALDALAIAGPPVDAIELARVLGAALAWDPRQQGRARTVRLSAGAGRWQRSILLRPEPRPERLQWATAHELGETLAVEVFERLGVDPREAPAAAREQVANQLAGRLLLPRDWFRRDARASGWDVPTLKGLYGTASHELIARRMLDFEPRIAITVFDHARQTFRRSNVPGRLPPWTALERAVWQAAHEASRPAVECTQNCRVQAWPVHEPEWKREIVRTEWRDEDGAFG